jgi:SAM-dependent methyltransferase
MIMRRAPVMACMAVMVTRSRAAHRCGAPPTAWRARVRRRTETRKLAAHLECHRAMPAGNLVGAAGAMHQTRGSEATMELQTAQDRINRRAWTSWGAGRWFGTLTDWTDPGEAAALARVSAEVRGAPLLDVGVGGGRTVPILRALSEDYVAIDYTPELVAICRHNHPEVTVRLMDARDLSAFADASFGLVMFSFNGIDAVDYAGRTAILREFARVLRPGGLLVFSTHNLHGPSYRENLSVFLRPPKWSANPLVLGFNTVRAAANLPLATINYLRYSRLNQQFDGYAVHVCAAHKFGIVIVYTELAQQQRTLATLGLHTEAVFGNRSAEALHDGDKVDEINWFHFVARKV